MQKVLGEQHITGAAGPVLKASKYPEKGTDINCRRDKRADEDNPRNMGPWI